MKQKKIVLILCRGIFLISLGFGVSAQADNYTCAKTFKVVNTGDSIEAVKAACGDPISTTARMDTVSTPVQTVRWFYMLLIDPKKPQIPVFSVSFKDGKVVQIEKSNILVPFAGNFPCLIGDMLKHGLRMEEVLAICGGPSSVSTSEIEVASMKEVIVLTYDMGQFYPKVQFEFEGGKLARIKR